MLFLADGYAVSEKYPEAIAQTVTVRPEPLTLLSALSAVTEYVGLAATVSTTYNEPFHVARKFASLDHLSGGRAAWNVVTSANPAEALNFNQDNHLLHSLRYDRAEEFLNVVTGLWDSWEDDAFVYDKASATFADRSKLHTLNHKENGSRYEDRLMWPGRFRVIRLLFKRAPPSRAKSLPHVQQKSSSPHGRRWRKRKPFTVM